MTAADLKPSGVREDFDPNTGQPIVLLTFTERGNKAFLQVTKNEATRGAVAGLGSNCGAVCAFAIVLNGEIRSWPAIDPQQNPRGIDPSGTGVEINNIGNLAEAKQLALVLSAGRLPVQLAVTSIQRTS